MGKSELGKKMNRKYFTYPNILVHTVVALLLWGLFTFFACTINSQNQNEIDYKVQSIVFHPLWGVGLLLLIAGMITVLWALEYGKKNSSLKMMLLAGVAVVLSIASGSLSIVSYYNSDAPSCFKLLEGETQYENGRCVHTTNVTYVEQTIALKGAPITVMRHDDRFGYVEGKEYTVTAGVFDGKEYKDGDTIFVTNQNGKYGVVSDRREDTISDAIGFVNSVTGGASVEKMRLGVIKTYVYKQDVENVSGKFIDDGHGTPHSISIDGREYVDTGKLNKESRNPRGELVTSHKQVYLIF